MIIDSKREREHLGKKAIEIEFRLPLPCDGAGNGAYSIIIYVEGATRYFLEKDQSKLIDNYYAGESGFKNTSNSTFTKKAFNKDMLIRSLIEEAGI